MGEPDNPSFSWFPDLAEGSMTPKTNIIYLRRHQDIPNNSRIYPDSLFMKYIFPQICFFEIEHFDSFEKTGAEES